MRISHLINAIARDLWALTPEQVLAYKLFADNALKGMFAEADKGPLMLTYMGDKTQTSMESGNKQQNNIPNNSVAVIPLNGIMVKEDTLCAYGTTTIGNCIIEAANNPKIIGTVIEGDSPGGATNSISPIAQAIRYSQSLGKPVVFLGDCVGSAAMYAASFADYRMASNNISSQWGSVGVMFSCLDDSKAMENGGLTRIVVYAPESNYKNQPFEELLKGKFDLIKAEVLSPLAQQFQADMIANIPELNQKTEGVLAGKMFFAKEAIAAGLCNSIGTLQDAVNQVRALYNKNGKTGNSAQFKINNVSPNLQNMNKYEMLCGLLGFDALEFGSDKKAQFSKDNINQITGAYKIKTGSDLELKGLAYDNDGFASLSEEEVTVIEAALNDPAAPSASSAAKTGADGGTQTTKARTTEGTATTSTAGGNGNHAPPVDYAALANMLETSFGAKFDKLAQDLTGAKASALGRVIKTNGKTESQVNASGYLFGVESSFNKIDDTRPWNKAAAGLLSASAITDIDISQVNQDLGEYIQLSQTGLKSLLAGDRLEGIFPTLMGYTGKTATLGIFVDEVIQAYQKAWTPKGGIKIQAEKIQMRDVKIDLEFEDLKTILKEWLSRFNQEGSQAYKMSFVAYLLQFILLRSKQDDNIAAIKGVYKAPVANVAGKAINTRDGLYQLVRKAVLDNKVKPIALGYWNKDNIVDYLSAFMKALPETVRDRANSALYVSNLFVETYWAARRLQEGSYPSYDGSKTTVPGWDNVRLIAVPFAGDNQRIIFTGIGNIVQLMNIKGEDKLLTLEKSKRVVSAFGDYEAAFHIGYVGKKEDNAENINMENQAIWINDVDEPESYYVTIDADVTAPSVSVHTSLETCANTQATAITDIADKKAGQIIRIKCGSTTNASTIANAGNFVLTSNWAPTSVGDELTLEVRADLKLVEYNRTSAKILSVELAADDATPSLGNFANGVRFVTNDANTADVAITNFDDATVGVEFTVFAAYSTKKTTIANGGNFVLTANWAETSATSFIKLKKRPADGKFIETSRG